MADALEFSELLMSRLCHDLAGPVGAINNGVELLKDPSPALHEESVDLIARLLYYRQAYGTTKNHAGISMSAIKDLVNNFYTNKNVSFIWPEAHGDSDSMQLIKVDVAKLILNLILIVAGTLMYGGKITVRVKNQKNDLGVKVRGEGKSVKLQEYVAKTLANDCKEDDLNSKNIQACLTAMLAKKIGGKIKTQLGKTDTGEDYIEIVAS